MRTFAERWAAKERELGLEAIAANMVQVGDTELPDSAAPCLSFNVQTEPCHIFDVYDRESDWSTADRARVADYQVIGSDGAGNPICTVGSPGIVVLVDHENNFQTVQFVNSTLAQLGDCLLAYMGESDPTRFTALLHKIDPVAARPGAFWQQEAERLAHDT